MWEETKSSLLGFALPRAHSLSPPEKRNCEEETCATCSSLGLVGLPLRGQGPGPIHHSAFPVVSQSSTSSTLVSLPAACECTLSLTQYYQMPGHTPHLLQPPSFSSTAEYHQISSLPLLHALLSCHCSFLQQCQLLTGMPWPYTVP